MWIPLTSMNSPRAMDGASEQRGPAGISTTTKRITRWTLTCWQETSDKLRCLELFLAPGLARWCRNRRARCSWALPDFFISVAVTLDDPFFLLRKKACRLCRQAFFCLSFGWTKVCNTCEGATTCRSVATDPTAPMYLANVASVWPVLSVFHRPGNTRGWREQYTPRWLPYNSHIRVAAIERVDCPRRRHR